MCRASGPAPTPFPAELFDVRRRQRTHHLSQVLGRTLRHRAVPAHVARRDGRARLGFLRRHPRHRRRVRRSPELRHGASSAGCSRRRAFASASSRSPTGRAPSRSSALGRPNLFFGVTAGNMDSMVNRYTSDKQIRSDDAYTPGGRRGKRPDRCVIVYAQRCREAFKDVPIVIGGIEASPAPHRALRLLERQGPPLACCWTPRPTCSCSATPSARSSRSRIASPPASTIAEINDLRGTAFVRKCARLHRDRLDARRHARASSNPPIDPYAMEPEIRKANEQAAAVEAGEARAGDRSRRQVRATA